MQVYQRKIRGQYLNFVQMLEMLNRRIEHISIKKPNRGSGSAFVPENSGGGENFSSLLSD